MTRLSASSHATMTSEEYQTLKMSEVSDVIYRRVESKLRMWCGDKARVLLGKYADKQFKDVVNCSVIDLTDCYTVVV